MRTLPLLLALGLALSLVALAPAAAAFNCDGDPMYWNTDYPTYGVCKAIEPWPGCLTRTGPCPT